MDSPGGLPTWRPELTRDGAPAVKHLHELVGQVSKHE